MSQILQKLKPLVHKARNLHYSGNYKQSVNQFQILIKQLQIEKCTLQAKQDNLLTNQWQKLINEFKYEKKLSEAMIDIIAGNYQCHQEIKIKQIYDDNQYLGNRDYYQCHKLESGQKIINQSDYIQNLNSMGMRIQCKNGNNSKIIQKNKSSQNIKKQRQSQQSQKQKMPLTSLYKKQKRILSQQNKSQRNLQIPNNNKSYSKPWLVNARKDKKQEQGKSFLKFYYPNESGPDAQLIKSLQREVVQFNPNVTFDDIADLQNAKDVLEEAVLLPLAMPQLFKGLRRAWRGVLLFGPPGTGKTLLAKAIASSGKTTFFNVTASSLASKWRGQSQKLVKILFQMASFYAPTTIFIDQIDSLASKRGQKQDEASRKVKTQFMTKMDGASTNADNGKLIVVIAATNRPWDLDQAIRRRLQKRIYIPLPSKQGRKSLIQINIKNQKNQNIDIEMLADQTQGYSGADIANLCRQAAYIPIRRKIKKQRGLSKKLKDQKWIQQFYKDVDVPLTMQDFIQALRNTKSSVGKTDIKHYQNWMQQFGQNGCQN